ncbi:hypothetical protein OAH90_04525 [Alphaproteobacteria bacterium]|nr:hypothetical protein [Alphaproteobacteria bacterium]
MAMPSSSFARDLRLTITILFCGSLSGINIAKLAPSITELSTSFGLSLSQIGLLASVFTLIMVVAGVLIGGIVRGAGTKRILMAACANHKQRFGRISRIKVTAAFAAKTLQPLITTFGDFRKFVYSARNFHIIRRDNRDCARWCAA